MTMTMTMTVTVTMIMIVSVCAVRAAQDHFMLRLQQHKVLAHASTLKHSPDLVFRESGVPHSMAGLLAVVVAQPVGDHEHAAGAQPLC
jgi:hypothetical protein